MLNLVQKSKIDFRVQGLIDVDEPIFHNLVIAVAGAVAPVYPIELVASCKII